MICHRRVVAPQDRIINEHSAPLSSIYKNNFFCIFTINHRINSVYQIFIVDNLVTCFQRKNSQTSFHEIARPVSKFVWEIVTTKISYFRLFLLS